MAIFRESPIIGAVSGRLGGIVAARSKSGPVLRHRPAKITSTSERAQAARADFGNTAKDWNQLTAAEAKAWDDFARAHPLPNRLGVSRLLTGFQWFMRGGRVLWYQTATGVRLYLNVQPAWEWDWSTQTLYLDSRFDVDTTRNPTGRSSGYIGSVVWTAAQKTVSLNCNNAIAALIDLTNPAFDCNAIDTTALAASSTAQVYLAGDANYTYFQAWNPATLQLETYMAIGSDLTISLAGSLDTTQSLT